MKALLAKLATIVQTKAAVAVLGAVVVAGGGTAAAVAATHGQLAQPGAHASATHGTAGTHGDDGAGQGNQDHASAEGILKSCTPAATCDASITVKKNDGTSVTFVVNASTKVNGAHANSLADLPGVIGGRVQVQADKQSDGSFLASKITVQGGDTGDQTGPTVVHGTVRSVDATGTPPSFVLTTDSGTVTVAVTTSTRFHGKISGLADLHGGARVNVQGIAQPDGSIVATGIEGGD